VQAPVLPQKLPGGHWLSFVHATPPSPALGSTQVWVVASHVPWMHWALRVHGPSPTAKPHSLLFMSHAPDTQTRCPTAVVQAATLAGIVGSDCPFFSFASHVPEPPGAASHHCDERHSESVWQWAVQRPLVVSQTVPSCPLQSAFSVHLPHVPARDPVRKQKGALIDPQGSAAVLPKSPSQKTQVEDVTSQTGRALPQSVELTHWTHALVFVSQVGVAPEHCELTRQATQSPWFDPAIAQIVERQSVAPSAAVHGPSPFA
jgi:hypothetical protein